MKSTGMVKNGCIVCKLSKLHWANRWLVMDGHSIVLECERVTMDEFLDMLNSAYGDYRFCECFETATGETFMRFNDIDFDGEYIVKI